MAEPKTKPTDDSVGEFLNSVAHDEKRADSFEILALMEEITGEEPQMWGKSIIGYGRYHYKYASGREAEWFLVGFSPRVQSLTLYIMSGFDSYNELLGKLGKYKIGKSCLYINKLADVDRDVLKELVKASVDHMRETNA
jgi:hypothetical protein